MDWTCRMIFFHRLVDKSFSRIEKSSCVLEPQLKAQILRRVKLEIVQSQTASTPESEVLGDILLT